MGWYSHSRLETFKQCALKYKFQYIDKIEVDIPTTIEAFLGDLVHQTLERLYADLMNNKLNSPEDLIVFFNSLWNEHWVDNILIVKNGATKEDYRIRGEHLILGYYLKNKPFNQTATLGVETKDFLDLDGEHKYHIRIDRLADAGGGNYEVHDFKTSSRLKSQEAVDNDKQLAMYSLWVKKNFGDAKKIKLVWHFLAFNKEMISERSDEELELLRNEVLDAIKVIESTNNFKPSVTPLCNWCVFHSICPVFNGSESNNNLLSTNKENQSVLGDF
ncbi:MAG: PD-(D/E)XK nuclease family protein [Nanoarchaeota archaeon]